MAPSVGLRIAICHWTALASAVNLNRKATNKESRNIPGRYDFVHASGPRISKCRCCLTGKWRAGKVKSAGPAQCNIWTQIKLGNFDKSLRTGHSASAFPYASRICGIDVVCVYGVWIINLAG